MNKQTEKLKEKILDIEYCVTDIECPLEPDDPCAECRRNQFLSLIKQHTYLKAERELPDMVFYCKDCDKMIKNTHCNIIEDRNKEGVVFRAVKEWE